jgi:hypothetical protein
MTIKAVYHRTYFQVTISKDDLYDLIDKGGAEIDFYIEKLLAHPGAVILAITTPVRADLDFLVTHEREAYASLKTKKRAGTSVPQAPEDPGGRLEDGERA